MEHVVVRWAPRGFPFIILGQENEWSRVLDFRNREGWVGTRFLVDDGGVILKISRSALHNRPGTGEGDIVTELYYGTILQVKETAGAWLKVATAGGVSGWLHEKNVWPQEDAARTGVTE